MGVKEVGKVKGGHPAPDGVSGAVGGQVPPMSELQSGLQRGRLIGIVTIFLLLVANFQSLRLAVIVLTTIRPVLLYTFDASAE